MALVAFAGRVGRLSFRRRRAGFAVAAGLAGRHAATPVFRRSGRRHAADWLLAHRLPAPSGVPRVARAVRPGGAGAFDVVPARAADPGRLPGVLPDRARGQDAAAGRRAGGVRILRARARAGRRRVRASARWRPCSPIAVYLAIVIPSRTNIGVRHVLPVLPLIAAAGRPRRGGAVARRPAGGSRRAPRPPRRACGSSRIPFAAAPDYFPWFNALAGRHPERVLIDSDLDWGQDLLRLERELAAIATSTRSTIAYFGASDICRHALPHLTWLRPRQPVRGWIAISQTFRHGIDGSYYRDGNPCDRIADGRRRSGPTPRSTTGSTPTSRWRGSAPRSCSTTFGVSRTRTARLAPRPSRDYWGTEGGGM